MSRVQAGLVALCAAATSLVGCAAPGPPSALLPEGAIEVARFGDARALATDGAGRLYVVDAAASVVVVLSTSGAILDRLGGTDDEAFLDATDVDPTNGQAVFVSDAATGRVVRYTAEGRAAETLSVPRLDDATSASGRLGSAASAELRTGRPVAVAAGPGSVVYAAEAERGIVLRWDADRTLDRVLSAPPAIAPFQSPSALCVLDDGSLLVGDGDRVVQFDAFGAFRREVATGPFGRVEGVVASGGRVWVVGRQSLARLDGDELREVLRVEGPLVDAAVDAGSLYLLTRTRLVRLPASVLDAR